VDTVFLQATSAQRALAVLSERGLAAAVITLGSAGALLAAGKERWYAQGPRVHVVSTVGSGDSFLGGLVSALDIGRDWHEALRDAVAAGTANTLSAGAGQFTLEEFNAVRGQVQVHAW
jgi:fructose-1-phosphate kinase PfkB-like protein